MAITTLDGLVGAARQSVDWAKTTSATTVALNPSSLLDVAGTPGAGTLTVGNTTAGLLVTDTTGGYPALNSFGGATGYLAAVSFGGTVVGRMALKDRLWNAGSVVMTSLATTTFSSPPSYLGRCPDGAGVGIEIWIEINAAVSATATTIAVGYTNSAGTTGRSTGATATLSGFAAKRLIQMPLQTGDIGVQAITSVTVGGTVATTGSFNVIAARPLVDGMRLPVAGYGDTWSWDKTGLVQVYDTTAFWPIVFADSTASGIPEMMLTVVSG